MEDPPTLIRQHFPAFPFKPYAIQIDFMSFLYQSLHTGGVSMLESPTGTGKTLSIICSALQWIVDQRKRCKKITAVGNSADRDDEPDWMRDFVVADVEMKGEKRGKGLGFARGGDTGKKTTFVEKTECHTGDDESEFLLDDYETEDDEEETGFRGLKRKGGKDLDYGSSDEDEDYDEEEEVSPKVYFTSRTHSQLSQFVKEFRKTVFASEINLVCLGSRKNLCINPEVVKLGNASQMNERCLELQRSSGKSKIKVQHDNKKVHRPKRSCGCPMLKKHKARKSFKDKILELGALDIEDLYQLGSKNGTCPYYGSRDMVRASDLVVLPYQSLLQKSSRESLGLNLKNNIVVIDEAHNLADSLTNMYNAKITSAQLKQVLSHLQIYLDKFRSRLGASNRRYIQILIAVAKSFLQLLLGQQDDNSIVNSCPAETAPVEEDDSDISMTINEFLFSLDIDNINFAKVVQYVKESNIMHKVSGYGLKLISSQNSLGDVDNQRINTEGSIVSSFQALADVFLQLTNKDNEGRIILSRQKLSSSKKIVEAYLKYVMLSGETIFTEIMNQVHAVVLTGGTLQPIEETRVRLFPDLSIDQVRFFACKHIVPPESILPIAVSCGPSGLSFDFSYNSRSCPSMIEELGRLIANLAAIIPEGVVVFFSSFEYQGQVYNIWQSTGIIHKILKKKRLFREPRNSTDVEAVLNDYKECIESSSSISKVDLGTTSGAILLAVVGGKVSEGINFSDGMGRCVVMVGLPYPSLFDVELSERIKHIDGLGGTPEAAVRASCSSNNSESVHSGFNILKCCKQRGTEYYENLCMKAVNQSIGRAIRHINDYAAVLLVDSRYACNTSNQSFSRPADKLPLWIRDRLVFNTGSYGEVHRLLYKFYQLNKQRGRT